MLLWQNNVKKTFFYQLNVFLNVYEFSTYLWKTMLKLWKKGLINVSRPLYLCHLNVSGSCDLCHLNPSGPCDLCLLNVLRSCDLCLHCISTPQKCQAPRHKIPTHPS